MTALAYYSFRNAQHVTAPKLVWRMFFIAYLIWLFQTCTNGYFDYYDLTQPQALSVANSVIGQSIKLVLLMGGAVMMNQNYKAREKELCLSKP